MNDVLVTYAWVRSSYAAMRNLVGHGLKVWVADSHDVGMCQWSRYKSGFSKYTSHYDDESAFVRDVVRICETNKISLVFPSHNETEVLARNRSLLPDRLATLLPDAKQCALFNDKDRSADFARSLGVSVPAPIKYSTTGEIEQKVNDARAKRVVVKLRKGNGSKGVFYAESARDAQILVERLAVDFELDDDRLPLIEERVPGVGVGYSFLFWHGECVADFGHIRVREKIETGGTSTVRESFHHDGMREAAISILSAAGWHGLAMVEFKYDPAIDEFWFIEVNPRMWGSISLPIGAGTEFPYLAWLCANDGPGAARDYHSRALKRHPWRYRWLLGDGILALSHLRSGRLRDALSALGPTGSHGFDDVRADDPTAFVGEAVHYALRAISSASVDPVESGMVG